MNRFTLVSCLVTSLSVGALYGAMQQVELKDGSYVVKNSNQGWTTAPTIDTTGSTLVGENVTCYVNTKERVISCYTNGKTWGPQVFNNIRSVEKALGTQIKMDADYIGTLVTKPSNGMAGGGKRLDFYQEKFVGGVQ